MYSEKLIEEVKACYPDDATRLLMLNVYVLGRHLDDRAHSHESRLLELVFNAPSLQELQEEARLIKRKRGCYLIFVKEITF